MNQYKQNFWKNTALFIFALLTSCFQVENKSKPNVIIIMTDDQGIGDFGFTGNPYIKTPNLDKLASQSLNLTNFYVSPVCAPTRASLMTGCFNERTGVYDTYNGGAVMSETEITIAEILKNNGYETGIFGKWHLGDNYPYRPSDQGFEVSVVHRGGGMGQPGDVLNYFAGDSSYFNPVLFKNDLPVQTKGYCSDISAFENRTLFFEWGRGYLQKYRNFAALRGNYKLVGNTSRESGVEDFELFDVKKDPQEKHNVLKENLEIANTLKTGMDAWYDEIISEGNNIRNFPAYIGTPYENPVILNRNDAKGTPVAWTQEDVLNYWDVRALEDGIYNILYHFVKPINESGKVCLKLYPYNIEELWNNSGTSEWTFKNVKINKGDYRLEPYFQTKRGNIIFPFYVSVDRVDK